MKSTNMTNYNAVTPVNHFSVGNSSSHIEPYQRPFDDLGIQLSGVIIFTFLIIGIALNLLTILVICKYKKLRNLFVYFIFSLCVSDLISAIISSLFWYRRTLGFDLWEIPDFFCKFFWAADITTTFSTALHIMAFAVLRWIWLNFPTKKIKTRTALIIISLIWFLCITCGFVPYAIFCGSRIRDRYGKTMDARWPACTLNPEWIEEYLLFQRIAFPIFLYVPLGVIVIVSVIIVVQLRASIQSGIGDALGSTARMNRRRQIMQAVLQLMLIVISFLIGYVPFTAYEFWSLQHHPNTRYHRVFDYWFGMSEYLCIRFSECLNPIFYNIGSSKMRKCTIRYIKEKFGVNEPQIGNTWITTNNASRRQLSRINTNSRHA
ncbi:blue-sensitive opsin-like [Styela clava]